MDISLARPYDEEFRKAAFKQARFEYLDIFLVLVLTSSAAKFDRATLVGEGRFPTVKELVDVLNYKWTCDLDWLAALVDLHNLAEF
ncbi:hypothetical protein FDECE_1030 [Fusarium decemcellulare]|nr:hypothetical protein FDECE_1030 [Fusarium decemcellulare]